MEDEVVETKSRTKRFGRWASDHSDDIVMLSITALTIGVSIWAAKIYNQEMRAYIQKQDEIKAAVQQAVSEGKSVLPNSDGSYWIIDNRSK